MDKKDKEILEKEFVVEGKRTICRGDYESLPLPMKAYDWTDEQMQELAEYIGREIGIPTDETYNTKSDEAFDRAFEDCAVKMGMEYYDKEENVK